MANLAIFNVGLNIGVSLQYDYRNDDPSGLLRAIKTELLRYRSDVTGDRFYGRVSQLVVWLMAAAIAAAFIRWTADQIEHERRVATRSAIVQNQARVDALYHFVLRTLHSADLVAAFVNDRQDLNSLRANFREATYGSGLGVGALAFQADKVVMLGQTLDDRSLKTLKAWMAGQETPRALSPPLRLSDGRTVLGVIRLDGPGRATVFLMRPERFTEVVSGTHFNTKDLISVIGLDGITRARREGQRLSSGEDLQGKLVMDQQRKHPDGTYFGPSGVDGVPRVFSHRRIEPYRIFATSGMGPEAIFAPLEARRRTYLTMLGFALVALTITLGIAVEMIGRRARQMANLGQAIWRLDEAQRIAEMGDWDYYPATDKLVWGANLKRLYGKQHGVSSLDEIKKNISQEEYDRIRSCFDEVIATRSAVEYEIEARLADGTTSHRRIIVSPTMDSQGRVVRVHGIDLCIDKDVRLTQVQAAYSTREKLDAMNALTATLAHELNQPLGVAVNFLSAARRRLSAQAVDQARDFINKALEQIEAVATIVEAARQNVAQTAAPERISLDDALDQALVLYRGHAREFEVTIDRDFPADALFVMAQLPLIKQVLHNLIKNAVDATPLHRRPSIRVYSRKDPQVRLVNVSVADNGDGLDGKDPFETLRTRKANGLGLGLALSRTIVEGLGGRIWVEKSGREGTILSFCLPAAS